jgi:hypothetical protein
VKTSDDWDLLKKGNVEEFINELVEERKPEGSEESKRKVNYGERITEASALEYNEKITSAWLLMQMIIKVSHAITDRNSRINYSRFIAQHLMK